MATAAFFLLVIMASIYPSFYFKSICDLMLEAVYLQTDMVESCCFISCFIHEDNHCPLLGVFRPYHIKVVEFRTTIFLLFSVFSQFLPFSCLFKNLSIFQNSVLSLLLAYSFLVASIGFTIWSFNLPITFYHQITLYQICI